MSIWYMAEVGRDVIVKVEVARTTAQSVFITTGKSEERNAMRSNWKNYFATVEEAQAFIQANAKQNLNNASIRYTNEQKRWAKVEDASKIEVREAGSGTW